MAKLTSLIILVLAVAVFSESALGQRSKTRSKVSSVRKKKVATTAATTTPVPIETTTIAEEEIIDETSPDDETTTVTTVEDSEANFIVPEEEQSAEEKLSPKLSKFLSRNPKIVTSRVTSAYGCDEECDKEDCVTPDVASCPTGLVLDRCNCCLVCSAGEGNRCNDDILNLPYNPDIGICGPGLVCKLRSDLELFDTPEALCECRDKRIVCGSDNRTYSSECKLREAASAKPELIVAMWSPCVSAPWIPTRVENTTVSIGDEVALSCEVRGYPAPVVHWEFIADGRSSSIVLPGDDSSVVVVNRGGPEQMMTTSWIQIIGVTPRRQGKYVCSAKNPEGIVQSEAFVSVYKSSG
ncbi:unnamed protein product [Allacma fusca]|uniref:IGFBP-related protein 1 n=1 Tax=Allacma fusca TaxID=39272 RepID=A0A8J2PGV8_9HEXA|nr:unnamed protein product [Allacma fusca]